MYEPKCEILYINIVDACYYLNGYFFMKEIIHTQAMNMHQIQAQTENWQYIKLGYIVLLNFTKQGSKFLFVLFVFILYWHGFFLYLWCISGELAHCVLGWLKSKGDLAGAYFGQYCCSVQASSWKFSIGRLWRLLPFSVLLSVICHLSQKHCTHPELSQFLCQHHRNVVFCRKILERDVTFSVTWSPHGTVLQSSMMI